MKARLGPSESVGLRHNPLVAAKIVFYGGFRVILVDLNSPPTSLLESAKFKQSPTEFGNSARGFKCTLILSHSSHFQGSPVANLSKRVGKVRSVIKNTVIIIIKFNITGDLMDT